MRNFKILFIVIAFSFKLIGQHSIERAGYLDQNVNTFMYSTSNSLINLTTKINSDGTLIFKNEINVSEQDILQTLGVPQGVSFVKNRERKSRFNNDIKFEFYQQYLNGVKVDGGGYTSKTDKSINKLVQFSPNIYSNFNINTIPNIEIAQLPGILNVAKVASPELLISDRYGPYKLIWSCYTKNNNNITSQVWIDASTGVKLEEFAGNVEINGTTSTYGVQNLNDNTAAGVTSMEWPNNTGDNSLRIFEANYGDNPVNPAQWDVNDIPSTTSNTTWDIDANISSRQTFYTANLVIPEFLNMGVDFGNVRIATHTTADAGAFAYFGSTIENAYVNVGTRAGGIPVSVFDITAHELGHCYLMEFLNYTSSTGNRALHEGIADIIGSYIESFIQPDGADWITGDDEPALAAIYNRDQTILACFDDLQSSGHHQLGRVISHWFFAIATGIPDDDISALGIQQSMDILVEALNNLSNLNAGFPQMRQQTLLVAETNFGVCSPQYQSIANAWDRVCVGGQLLNVHVIITLHQN